MDLPILNARSEPTSEDLIRLFDKTETHWTEHLAEPEGLDVGTAFCNPQFGDVYDANHIRDVALPDGISAADAFQQVLAHYSGRSTRCAYWTFNPSAPASRTQPLIDYLLVNSYQAIASDIMILRRPPTAAPAPREGLRVIPARASFRHARELFEDEGRRRNRSGQFAEAALAHLDDPHWDALLAIRNSAAVAYVGVLAVGEIGKIEQLLVAEPFRRQRLGRLMMARAVEICARALFKHVMLGVRPDNAAAVHLHTQLGFHRLGQLTSYYAPWTTMKRDRDGITAS